MFSVKRISVIPLLLACFAYAQPDEVINAFSPLNYSGFMIDSDGLNVSPSYNRDALLMQADVIYNNNASMSVFYEYEVRFSLLDGTGSKILIWDPTNSFSTTDYVVPDSFSISGPASMFRSYPLSGDIALKPFNQLSNLETYSARLEVYKKVGGVFGSSPVVSQTYGIPLNFWHFQNTTSGDPAMNVQTRLDSAYLNRTFMVASDPANNSFTADVTYTMARYDDFYTAPTSNNVDVNFLMELRDSANNQVPLANSSYVVTQSMDSFVVATPFQPYVQSFASTLKLVPSSPTALDFSETYTLTVTIRHKDTPGSGTLTTANALQTGSSPLLYLSGNLYFNTILTTINQAVFVANPGTPSGSNMSTTLVLANGGAQVVGTSHTLGDGAQPLLVDVQPNGDAIFTGTGIGSPSVIAIPPSTPDSQTLNGVYFERVEPTLLNTSGAQAEIRVRLPAGLGHTTDPTGKLLTPYLSFPNLSLNNSLEPPSATLSYSPGGTFWACEESKPLLFGIQSITWTLATGLFELNGSAGTDILYVRKDELDYLDSLTGLVNSDGGLKRSNEQYYRFVTSYDNSQLDVNPDSGDNSARLTTLLDWQPPGTSNEFTTHFPYGSEITWTGSGQATITDDQIDPTVSSLTDVQPVSLSYDRDCGGPDCGGGVGPATLTTLVQGDTLTLTPDGGLASPGTLSAVSDITWGFIPALGVYAQEARSFEDNVYHMPGHYLDGAAYTQQEDEGPGVLLLTGVDSAGQTTERPGTTPYQQGDAWYGGLNFNVPSTGDHWGKSVLAGNGSIPTYPLTFRSKYYLRPAGVTGVHQADNGTFTPPDIYGHTMNFQYYGLAYLDSLNVDSVTSGNLLVQYPSDLDLDFERLMVTCMGALETVEMADTVGSQILKYWNADIDPLSLEFERDAADQCDPGVGYLAMGVTGYASHLAEVFHGKLGFKSDGNLITLADGLVTGRDSRLTGPNTVSFPGPKGETYRMDLTSKLYYNNYDNYNASGEQGFVNLAGQINVPFFKDIKIHLQTRGDKDSTIASLDLAGGWPDHGWEIAGENFFTQAPFDDGNRGFPTAVNRDFYLNKTRPEPTQEYLPRAQQSWLGIVNFDYPMNWSQFDRSFSSYKAEEDKFLIVEVEHQVPYLSAENAEMVFGAEYDGIPQLSLANFAQSLIDDNVMGPMRDAVDQGKDSLEDMLNDQVMKLFDPVLDGLVDPLVDELYEELREVYEDAATSLGLSTMDPLPFDDWEAAYDTAMHCYVTGPQPLPASCPIDNNLLGVLEEVIGAVDDASSLLKEIDKHLANTEMVIDVFTSSFRDPEGRVLSDMDGMFVCDNSGNINFAIAEELVKRLLEAQDLGFDLSVLARAIDEKLQPLFKDHMGTLKDVATALQKLKTFIGQVRTVLQDGGEMIDNLKDKLETMDAEINGVVTDVDTRVKDFFQRLDTLNNLVFSPFEEYPADEMKAMIKQEIKDAFYSSPIGTELQVIIKQNLFDANGAICRGIDDVFAQINKVIEDLLTEVFADLDEKIIPFLDKLNGIIGAGKLDGYAHLSEDAIRYARMDANLEWEIPEPMSFHGYIEIKQLNAEGSDNACYAESPGVINEVTIGATNVPLNWVSEGLRADVYGKTTFQTAPDFKLLGIGGGFEITEGEIKFEKFVITELGAALALGKEETFLAAKAHAKFESVQAGVGVFFGRTCTLDPLIMVDSDVGTMLGGAPFTGAYIYGEAWIPILEYSCALRLSAGAGIGLGYFVEGPTYIGKMKLGVSGQALCIVSVTGEIVLVGIKQGDDFKFKGTGTVKGEVGKCRWFCIKFNKSVTIEK